MQAGDVALEFALNICHVGRNRGEAFLQVRFPRLNPADARPTFYQRSYLS
jgi:hypothetical protein